MGGCSQFMGQPDDDQIICFGIQLMAQLEKEFLGPGLGQPTFINRFLVVQIPLISD